MIMPYLNGHHYLLTIKWQMDRAFTFRVLVLCLDILTNLYQPYKKV